MKRDAHHPGPNHFKYQWKSGGKDFFKSWIGFASCQLLALAAQPIYLDLMMHVGLALKRKMYNLKKYFFPNIVFIYRAKHFLFQERILPKVFEIDLAQADA